MIRGKQIVMPVDFLDHVYQKSALEKALYTADDIRRLLATIRQDAHADACVWRVSACGSMTYRSQVEEQCRWDPRAPVRAMNAAMDAYDPLAEAVKAGNAVGLPVYAWMTLFDEGYPPHLSRCLREHPEQQWTDRMHCRHLPGVPCYDYEEPFNFRLEMVRELLAYGVDGLYLCMRSHSDQGTPHRQKDFFGFNDPVVAEFKRRHGVDLRRYDDARYILDSNHFCAGIEYIGGDFDVNAWHRLKGESLTRLLREIRKLAGPSLPIWVCFLGPFEDMDLPEGARSYQHLSEGIHPFARLHLDWQTWLKEKSVNTLVIQCHHGMAPEYGVMPFVSGVHALGGQAIWLERVGNRPLQWGQTEEFAQRIAHLPFEGVMPYEAENFEFSRARLQQNSNHETGGKGKKP